MTNSNSGAHASLMSAFEIPCYPSYREPMKADKRAWWSELKERIGLGIERPEGPRSRAGIAEEQRAEDERKRVARELRLERIAAEAEVLRQEQEKQERQRAAEAVSWREQWHSRQLTERAGFSVGQRVRNLDTGKCGTVIGIEDLSYCIPQDIPKGTRNFSLRVRLDNGSKVDWNGAYWKKV